MVGNKCWNCARLARCPNSYRVKNMESCTKFIRYIDKIPLNRVAQLCGVVQSTVSRWLLKDIDKALKRIEQESGFKLAYEKVNEYRVFELADPTAENCIKLAKRLKELEEQNDIK